MQGAWVWSLVEGLRSHMLLGTAKKIKINKITKRKKLWGVKDAEEWKAKRWDWVEGENLATSVQKRMLWKEGLAFGVSQVQDRWAQGKGDQAAEKVPVGVVRPCCSPLHRATGPHDASREQGDKDKPGRLFYHKGLTQGSFPSETMSPLSVR